MPCREAVHHITVFGCSADVEARYPPLHFGNGCGSWEFSSGADAPCSLVVYAYDKGGLPFEAGAYTRPLFSST
jgi:hypothetical protein